MTENLVDSSKPWIDTRQVGDAAITIISEGGLLWDPRFAVPEEEWRAVLPGADEQGRLWIGLNVVFVRLGDALILIDPGLDDPGSQWQRDLSRVWPDWPCRRTPGLAMAMTQLGIAPDDVTHVVITHPHGDHYAGVAYETDDGLAARFPRARHFIGRADWEGNPHRGQPETALARLELIDDLGLLQLVDEEIDVLPGVTLIPAPGETPGHLIVRVQSLGEQFLFLGDLVHLHCEVEHADWMPPSAIVDALASSRARFFADAARDRPLLATAHEHFPPWGHIVATENGYRWKRI